MQSADDAMHPDHAVTSEWSRSGRRESEHAGLIGCMRYTSHVIQAMIIAADNYLRAKLATTGGGKYSTR